MDPEENKKAEVLIVGAGPTGLNLALWLTKLGIKIRIIDKNLQSAATSRALVLHARTLEFYAQMGWADEVLNLALKFNAVNLWAKGKKAARVFLGDLGEGLSPYSHLLIFPQDQHEQFLIEKLSVAGVEVERGTELVSFTQAEGVTTRLKLPSGEIENYQISYLAGCDGARSQVRETLKTGFSGTTYSYLFYVADAEATGSITDKELHILLDADYLFLGFPLKGKNRVRLLGTIKESVAENVSSSGAALAWKDVNHEPLDQMNIKVLNVNWFSTYHVHHRVADHFRFDRVFLLGDAAHIHSPVGGQGMNTGIADAINLSWKLAEVILEKSENKILDTYETERIGFARRLVATTDRAFTAVTSQTFFACTIRTKIIPFIVPKVTRFKWVRRFIFKMISQISIEYRNSNLSRGRAGKLHAGDRLPWILFESPVAGAKDNFDSLKAIEWQVHFYGEILPEQRARIESLKIPLSVFPWQKSIKKAGFRQKTAYVIRPDGYIGSISTDPALQDLKIGI